MLYREPKLLKDAREQRAFANIIVSVLYREPKLLKASGCQQNHFVIDVSVLYREPKLLKECTAVTVEQFYPRFSALP